MHKSTDAAVPTLCSTPPHSRSFQPTLAKVRALYLELGAFKTKSLRGFAASPHLISPLDSEVTMRSVAFKASCLFFLLPLLSGCIGIGVIFPMKEAPWVKPRIGKSVGTLSGFPRGYRYPFTEEDPGATCTEVIAQWGEPDHQSVDGSETTLVYRHGVAWAGIMPIILFPIPVALPVFPKSTTLTCKDNVLMSAYQIATGMATASCGVLDEGGVRWGCAFGN